MTINVDALFYKLSHPRFLGMRGLSNDLPLFIQAYDVQKEDVTSRRIEQLIDRLRLAGVELAHVDLFDLSLEVLQASDWLDPILAREAALGKQRLLATLQNATVPRDHLIPRLLAKIDAEGVRLSLLTGAGRAFPFLRAHMLLEALQPAMPRHPIVLFFPGQYDTDGAEAGSHLRLFGRPSLSKAYYRAFNLDHYQP